MRRTAALLCLVSGAVVALHALQVPAKGILAQWLLTRAWLASGGTQPVRPWPGADAWPVARLSVPGDEPQIVLAGTEGSALAFAPAWLMASAPPGAPGTTVVAAHRDTHFRGLGRVAVGDRITLELTGGTRIDYRVTRREVRDAAQGDLRLPVDGARRLALVTCYPLDAVVPGGPLRYVVWAVEEDAAGGWRPRHAAADPPWRSAGS
jgi:sortase A